jgi:tetratricopeptide (TPR) repeat protein
MIMQRKWAVGVLALCGLIALAGCGGGGGGSTSGKKAYEDQVADVLKKKKTPSERAVALIKIAGEQGLEAKDSVGARKTLEQAFRQCSEIEDAQPRAAGFAAMAEVQAKLNFTTEAKNSAQKARDAADKIDDAETKAEALGRIGKALGALGEGDKAAETLKEAEGQIAKIADEKGRVLKLAAVAASYDAVNKVADADRVLADAVALAHKMTDDGPRGVALGAVALEQSRMKRTADAAKTFTAALEAARKSAEARVAVNALIDIAEMLSKAGDAKQTHEVLKEAEKLCAKIEAPDAQKQGLDRARDRMNKLPKPASAG